MIKKFSGLFAKLSNIYHSGLTIWAILVFGILVRLIQYLSNRSLWIDEAMLALNIVKKSYSELCGTLDHLQMAPLAFLMVEKFFLQLFGNNEYALRLFPFLAACLALVLFLKVSRLTLAHGAVPLALLAFVSSRHLIYFSSELKQYSVDVTAVLLVTLTALYCMSRKPSFKSVAALALVGMAGLAGTARSSFRRAEAKE